MSASIITPGPKLMQSPKSTLEVAQVNHKKVAASGNHVALVALVSGRPGKIQKSGDHKNLSEIDESDFKGKSLSEEEKCELAQSALRQLPRITIRDNSQEGDSRGTQSNGLTQGAQPSQPTQGKQSNPAGQGSIFDYSMATASFAQDSMKDLMKALQEYLQAQQANQAKLSSTDSTLVIKSVNAKHSPWAGIIKIFSYIAGGLEILGGLLASVVTGGVSVSAIIAGVVTIAMTASSDKITEALVKAMGPSGAIVSMMITLLVALATFKVSSAVGSAMKGAAEITEAADATATVANTAANTANTADIVDDTSTVATSTADVAEAGAQTLATVEKEEVAVDQVVQMLKNLIKSLKAGKGVIPLCTRVTVGMQALTAAMTIVGSVSDFAAAGITKQCTEITAQQKVLQEYTKVSLDSLVSACDTFNTIVNQVEGTISSLFQALANVSQHGKGRSV